jgi:hypothetical protein
MLPTIGRMLARRRHRLVTVLFALCSLLFMQLAVAGYACPMKANAGEVAAMAEAGLPCAGDMATTDADQPGLCHAHCQSGQQTADKVQVPMPTGAVAAGSSYAITPVLVSHPTAPVQAPALLRSTAPPLTVRNCCFRI